MLTIVLLEKSGSLKNFMARWPLGPLATLPVGDSIHLRRMAGVLGVCPEVPTELACPEAPTELAEVFIEGSKC